jgi:hypothetical protein
MVVSVSVVIIIFFMIIVITNNIIFSDAVCVDGIAVPHGRE